MPSVSIHYHRPGKPLTIYEEGLVSVDETCLRTFKSLPPEIADDLSAALQRDGLITSGQRVEQVRKTYFFTEHFNLLQFCDAEGKVIGYYSDIGTPLRKIETGYEMVDWFLDIWLYPEGVVRELDWDEFEAASTNGLLTPVEQRLATETMQRIKDEIVQGIYPLRYM